MRSLDRWFGAAVAFLLLTPALAGAEDFAVYSTVHWGDQASENTTLFRGGRVYDFLADPQEITIYDPPGQRFIVLDPKRRVKTEISTAELDAFTQRLRDEALARRVPLLEFLARPEFDTKFEEATGQLTMSAPWLTYKVKTTRPKHGPMVGQYVEFLNWQTKLNALLHPGSAPPFARLALNNTLEQHGRLPVEVEMTRQSQQIAVKPVTVRATHRVQSRLLETDNQRLDEADKLLHTLNAVSLADYRSPDAEPKRTERASR